MQSSHKAYIGLGTNLGHLSENLETAIKALQEHIGTLLKCSSFISTEPWGYKSANKYLNAVALYSTDLQPQELLLATQAIERQMGRTHKSINANYSDRIIDIDILFYDDLIVNEQKLTIPHPLIAKRDFVLIPLAEIAPDLNHPILNKTTTQLLKELANTPKNQT